MSLRQKCSELESQLRCHMPCYDSHAPFCRSSSKRTLASGVVTTCRVTIHKEHTEARKVLADSEDTELVSSLEARKWREDTLGKNKTMKEGGYPFFV